MSTTQIYAAEPPDGQTRITVNPPFNGGGIVPVAIVSTIIALMVLGLRLFTRTRVIHRGLGWDDCKSSGSKSCQHNLLTFLRSCHNLNGRIHLVHVSLHIQYVAHGIQRLAADVVLGLVVRLGAGLHVWNVLYDDFIAYLAVRLLSPSTRERKGNGKRAALTDSRRPIWASLSRIPVVSPLPNCPSSPCIFGFLQTAFFAEQSTQYY